MPTIELCFVRFLFISIKYTHTHSFWSWWMNKFAQIQVFVNGLHIDDYEYVGRRTIRHQWNCVVKLKATKKKCSSRCLIWWITWHSFEWNMLCYDANKEFISIFTSIQMAYCKMREEKWLEGKKKENWNFSF